MIELQRQLAISNLAEPDPPPVLHWLLGTHPTTMDRIGAALSFQRSEPATRPAGAADAPGPAARSPRADS
jgi:STE24 endopeptidase